MRTSTAEGAEGSGGTRSGASEDDASNLEPRARQAGRDPLLAAICHDLRAPIAAVMMGATFVLQTTPEGEAGERSRRVLEAMLRSCRQMERLVRDFGDLSEIEGGAVELRLGVHDAAEVLEIAAEAARPGALARNVRIDVSRPEQAVLVRCDRDRVLRALAHVLDNASRFAPDGSTVIARVGEEGDRAVFAVSDAGPGLSEETMAHLYERTWHARRTSRAGAGLGLAIVRGLVLAHGGRVDVESEPGAGATFSLVIPRSDPPPSSAGTDGG